VSIDDAHAVVRRVEAMAKAVAHGGYRPTMTSDPYIVSRVVFEWWWFDKGNRDRLFDVEVPHSPPECGLHMDELGLVGVGPTASSPERSVALRDPFSPEAVKSVPPPTHPPILLPQNQQYATRPRLLVPLSSPPPIPAPITPHLFYVYH
jgi:hypothetical protein